MLHTDLGSQGYFGVEAALVIFAKFIVLKVFLAGSDALAQITVVYFQFMFE